MDSRTICVLTVMFVATLFRSTFGFGEALVAIPLLVLWLPLKVATPLAVFMSVVVAGVILLQDWERVHVRSAGGLIAATLPGIPLGLLLLSVVNDRAGRVLVALILILFSAFSLLRKKEWSFRGEHPGMLVGFGFLAGILGGAYGMNGPPLVVYGTLKKWSPQHFRATLQGYFFPASLVGLWGYWAIGLWTRDVTRYSLFSLPPTIAAIFLGRAINKKLHPTSFLRYVHFCLLAIGISQLVRTIWK